jgi:hypothetical protein
MNNFLTDLIYKIQSQMSKKEKSRTKIVGDFKSKLFLLILIINTLKYFP